MTVYSSLLQSKLWERSELASSTGILSLQYDWLHRLWINNWFSLQNILFRPEWETVSILDSAVMWYEKVAPNINAELKSWLLLTWAAPDFSENRRPAPPISTRLRERWITGTHCFSILTWGNRLNTFPRSFESFLGVTPEKQEQVQQRMTTVLQDD